MRQVMPIMLGMNPPTKEVVLIKTETPMKGYAVLINHATFKYGVERGQQVADGDMERRGTACWLQFTDAETMIRFGEDLIKFAKGEQIGRDV